jgi:hypothetical protein
MDIAVQWNWVMFGYGVAYTALVLFTSSIAGRISRARRRLGEGG